MNPKVRNIFLAIGVAAIVVMLCTFDMSWDELWQHVLQAGYWLPAVILLWVPIYMINALSWQVIINDGVSRSISFWRVFKYTVSGYALNYVTPVGVLGGEPYRIMELTPYVGAAKASSSVILYAMMHIFSHFWFWAFSIVIYLIMYGRELTWGMGLGLLLASAFCALGIYFFMKGYKSGLAMRTLRFFGHWPLIGKRIRRFTENNMETVQRVDEQIAALHSQRPTTFYWSLFLEFLARVVGCVEVMFILLIMTPNVNFFDCILMQAFASLFANLMFFIPMEMGTREGGFALVTHGLSMSGGFGVLTGLVTRLRELFWIAVGMILIRVGNKKNP